MDNSISLMNMVFSISLALAVIFFALSVFLFFYCHIVDVYLDLSGKARREAIKKKRESVIKGKKYLALIITVYTLVTAVNMMTVHAADSEPRPVDIRDTETSSETESELDIEVYDLKLDYDEELISLTLEPASEYSPDDQGRVVIPGGVYSLTAEVLDDHYHISRISINDDTEIYADDNDEDIVKRDIQISGDTHICIEAEKDSYTVCIKGLSAETMTVPVIRRKPVTVMYNDEEISVSDEGCVYLEDVLYGDEILLMAEAGYKISRNNSLPAEALTISMTSDDAEDHPESDPVEILVSAIERPLVFHDGLTGTEQSLTVSVLSDNIDVSAHCPSEETEGYSFAGWYYNDGTSENTVNTKNNNTKGTVIETLDNKDPVDGSRKLFTSETENRTIDLYAVYKVDGDLSITAEGPVSPGGMAVEASSDISADGSALWFAGDVVLYLHVGDDKDGVTCLYSVTETGPDGSSVSKDDKTEGGRIVLSIDEDKARICECRLKEAYIEKTVGDVICRFYSSAETAGTFTVRQDICRPKVLSVDLKLPARSKWGIFPFGNYFNKDALITVTAKDICSDQYFDTSDKDAVNSGISGICLLIYDGLKEIRIQGKKRDDGTAVFSIPSDCAGLVDDNMKSYYGDMRVSVTDMAGNEVISSIDAVPEKNIESSRLHYDTIKPFCMLLIDGRQYTEKTVNRDAEYWIKKDSVLTLEVHDDKEGPEKNAGLYLAQYSINGKKYRYFNGNRILGSKEAKAAYDELYNDNPYAVSGIYKDEVVFKLNDEDIINGRNELTVRVYDLAGNMSDEETYIFYRDIYGPSVSLTGNNKDYKNDEAAYHDGGYWLLKDTDLKISVADLGYEDREKASDVNSGLKKVTITVRNTSDEKPVQIAYRTIPASAKAVHELSYLIKYEDLKEGRNLIRVKAVDQAENSFSKSYVLFVDKSIPEVSSLQVGGLKGNYSYGGFSDTALTVRVHVRDKEYTSGIAVMRFVYHYTEKSRGKCRKTYKYEENDAVKAKTSGINSEVYTISLDSDELMNTRGYFTVYLEDNVGNRKEYTDTGPAGEGFGACNLRKNSVTMENMKPVIHMETDDPRYIDKRMKAPDKTPSKWYDSADMDFHYSISDSADDEAYSGLSELEIMINGKKLGNTRYLRGTDKAAAEGSGSFDLSEADKLQKNGLNTIVLTVKDSAGNCSSEEYYVYVDTEKPEIAGVFLKGSNGDDTAQKPLYPEGAAGYGAFFNDTVQASVLIEDNNASSGIDRVCLLKKDVNGKQTEEDRTVNVSSNMDPKGKTDGKAVFTIKKEFKGQVYVRASDHAGNEQTRGLSMDGYNGKWYHAGGLIVESKAMHDKAAPHIRIEPVDIPVTYLSGQENPLYNDSVRLKITVADTYSGILDAGIRVQAPHDIDKNHEESAEVDLKGNISGGWKAGSRDFNLVTEMSKIITVENNSNDITVHVDMTDRCGNTSGVDYVLSIDRDAPEISVSFDPSSDGDDPVWNGYFDRDRTMTITVKERNFDPGLIKIKASKDGEACRIDPDLAGPAASDSDKESPLYRTYTMTCTFSADDSDFTFSVSGTDMAANEAAEDQTDYGSDAAGDAARHFTIDRIKPVTEFDIDGDMGKDGCYQGMVTGRVTVTERNFDPDRFAAKISVYDSESGDQLSLEVPVQWNDDTEDRHRGIFIFDRENRYAVSEISVCDKAGNSSDLYQGPEFTVDLSQPVIEFYTDQTMTEALDHTARSGSVAPYVVVKDTNYDRLEWTLSGYRHGDIEKNDYPVKTSELEGQRSGTSETVQFEDFKPEESYDDVYILSVTAYDKSGRIAGPESATFSVNRFGSTYMLDAATKALNDRYYISKEQDIKIMEINPVPLNENKTCVTVSCNGEAAVLESGRDYIVKKTLPYKHDNAAESVRRSESGWYEYTYTVFAGNFAAEGRYKVDILTSDKNDDTANIQSNETSKHDTNMFEGEIDGFVIANENNAANAPVEFAVDKTGPNLLMMDLEPQYMEDHLDVTITCTDAGKLKEVIYNVDSAAEIIPADEFEKNGGTVVRTLRSSSTKQKIRLTARDMAGNTSYYPAEGGEISVQVTRNLFYLLLNNTPALILAFLVIALPGGAIVISREKKRASGNRI